MLAYERAVVSARQTPACSSCGLLTGWGELGGCTRNNNAFRDKKMFTHQHARGKCASSSKGISVAAMWKPTDNSSG